MANRVVEVFYKLKDLFSGQVSKITTAYRSIENASDKTSSTIERNNARVSGSFDSIAGAIGKIRNLWYGLTAVIAAGGATAAFKGFVDQADKVGKLSDKLGVASEELSALGYAAERSNISFDTMSTALQRMIRRSAEAANGTGEAKDALKTLGINAKEFTQLSLENKMAALADAFQGVGDQGQRVALAMKLFDTEGVAMVQILQNGSAEMRALLQEAKDLGYVFSEESTAGAAKFNDTLTKLGATIGGIGRSFGTPIIEWANQLSAKFGVSADRADNLRAELEYLEERLSGKFSDFASLSPYDYFVSAQALLGIRDLRKEYEAVAEELKNLEEPKVKQEQLDKAAQEQTRENTQALAEQARVYKSVAENADFALKEKTAAFQKETQELQKAKSEQLSIEKEFQSLVNSISAPDKKDVSLLDFALQQRKASSALAKGEFDNAITAARQGGDLLEELKKKGTESQLVLEFLAKQLAKVANEAAKGKTNKEQEEARLAGGELKTMEAQIAVMTDVAKQQGDAAGIAYAEAMQQAMLRFELTPPKVAAPVIDSGGAFSVRRELDKRGSK